MLAFHSLERIPSRCRADIQGRKKVAKSCQRYNFYKDVRCLDLFVEGIECYGVGDEEDAAGHKH